MINKISIIMPAYNEAQTVEGVLDMILESDTLKLEKEIIVVDDGSTDKTVEILERRSADIHNLIFKKKNGGKGSALVEGFKAATGDLILIQDADYEYSPSEYPMLIRPFLEHNADVVYGSRFSATGVRRVLFFWHAIANRCLTCLSNCFTNLNLSDMETGYKVFKRSMVSDMVLNERGFGIEPELTQKLADKNCVFFEVGISYFGRTYEEGKKIGVKDAIRAFYVIVRYGVLK